MSNDHRDWTSGRFMHAPPVKVAPPTDKEIIDALVAALENVRDGVPRVLRDEGMLEQIDAALELARKGEAL
ncbi:hypothetical protein ACFPOD_04735 [Nitratireductor kimnyeongensis]|uniref:Uncharacterized protein n=1 Tax=Nitratireductor kimnyeongensis TaxID=430679 RepID=A0ABW0T5L5_9HYPH|nr:hypothetical protein [Nitratireductor kimnyeongensis]QZZ34608.1 hypothetical protein KW403_12460 [Nitratireductor kimnyeongensis]